MPAARLEAPGEVVGGLPPACPLVLGIGHASRRKRLSWSLPPGADCLVRSETLDGQGMAEQFFVGKREPWSLDFGGTFLTWQPVCPSFVYKKRLRDNGKMQTTVSARHRADGSCQETGASWAHRGAKGSRRGRLPGVVSGAPLLFLLDSEHCIRSAPFSLPTLAPLPTEPSSKVAGQAWYSTLVL